MTLPELAEAVDKGASWRCAAKCDGVSVVVHRALPKR
jgi:hypothetical protein